MKITVPDGGYVEITEKRWDVFIEVHAADGSVVTCDDDDDKLALFVASSQVNPGDSIWFGTYDEFEEVADI